MPAQRSTASRSKPSNRRSGPSRKGSATASRSPKASGRSAAPQSSTPPPPASRWYDVLIDGHGHDISGMIAVAVGVVAVFGVYFHGAGIVGRAIAAVIGAIFGLLRYLVPPALIASGVVLIVGPRRAPPEDPDAARVIGIKRNVGAVLAVVSVASFLHLATSPKSISIDGLGAFADAGGFIGALLGSPLKAMLTGWGAVPVLLVVLVIAVSLISGMPLRSMGATVARASVPLRDALGTWFGDLFRISADEDAEGSTDPTALFDQDADGQGLPKPKPKRARKKADDGPTMVLPPTFDPAAPTEQLEIDLGSAVAGSHWRLPPRNVLAYSGAQEVDTEAVAARGRQLEAALAEHGVQTRLVGMVVGPTVTRYELELGVGVKVNSVVNLSKDIAYNMASADVRIIAPIPGKQAIGVEVPNTKRQLVALGDILASGEAHRAHHPLEVAVGRGIEGDAVMINLATMPHVLIAGQTGAGKSSCINSIMTSILMRATPDQVRLILIDPKRVELTQYNRVPHLLTQVVTNPKKAANALAWAVKEMERRYELLEAVGCRDITGYNEAFDKGELQPELGEEIVYERLPFILIVVDELADLMMVAARDVEESINRIAAKARAVGVHLAIATQRPSVNVITGVIKANIPARFAFSVASATDSKVILDQGGADRLVGKGDMLVVGPSSSSPERIQGCFVDEKEVAKVVSHWRRQTTETHYVEEVQGEENLAAVGGGGAAAGDDGDDELLWQAMELVVRSQLGSTSMLQRKLKVGFARAGRLMDLLEERGVVGPSEGSKARTVLMSVPELDELLGSR